MELPEAVRALVERAAGPVRDAADRSWAHGVSRVWQLDLAGGARVWAKQHTQPRKYDQEVRAYRSWVPALAAARVLVPELLDSDRDLCAMVLTHLPGDPPPPHDPEVHRQAGAALSVLHGLPLEDHDPLAARDAVLARLARWTEEARGVVPPEVVERVTSEVVGGIVVFDGARRVACHRDFSPRNWLVHEGRLGLLDFEHAGPDLRMVDVLKLADDTWSTPGIREAFVEGYGRTWTDDDRERLRLLTWLHALSTWVWSASHGDAAYEAHARRLFAQLSRVGSG